MSGEQAPKTKLEEQSTGKAELSYSYWAANAVAGAPPPEPKRLTEEEAQQQQQTLTHASSGASLWNAAGTFEERSISLGWVQEQLAALLGGLRHSQGGAEVAVEGVSSCTGEAHQWLRRGKKTAGFELAIEFRWRAELGGGAAVTGSAKVPHAAADELDELALEVMPDSAAAAATAAGGEGGAGAAAAPSDAQRQQAKAAVSGLLPLLEVALGQLLQRCTDK